MSWTNESYVAVYWEYWVVLETIKQNSTFTLVLRFCFIVSGGEKLYIFVRYYNELICIYVNGVKDIEHSAT